MTCLPRGAAQPAGADPGGRAPAHPRGARDATTRIFVAYADCGTGGLLDRGAAPRRASNACPGAHCYEVFAGQAAFAALMDEEPGTFYLTDFLARNFERLVVGGLGIDRHPELRAAYFGAYRRVVYLAQTDDPALIVAARAAAARLGLAFERAARATATWPRPSRRSPRWPT